MILPSTSSLFSGPPAEYHRTAMPILGAARAATAATGRAAAGAMMVRRATRGATAAAAARGAERRTVAARNIFAGGVFFSSFPFFSFPFSFLLRTSKIQAQRETCYPGGKNGLTYHGRVGGKRVAGGGRIIFCGVLLKNVVTFGSRRLLRTFSGNGT